MTRLFGRNPTLTALVALGTLNHVGLSGSRVTVTLQALREGASTATVGLILSLYALLPMLCAVAAGRFSDRVGVRKPILVGSTGLVLGSLLPLVFQGLPVLLVSACVVGFSFMIGQVATQNATGELGPPSERAQNFSLLALGYSVSGFLAPLVVGFTIDQGGFKVAFALLALLPFVPIVVLTRGMVNLPGPHPAHTRSPSGGAIALLRHPTLRRVFAMNVLLSMAWDLHQIVIPVYGTKIGLSASAIGLVLGSFGAATFLVRLLMPWIARRANEYQVLTGALVIGGIVYFVFPFSTTAPALMALSFFLGLGLGMSQPMVMSLLHTHAPPGRMGEAAGVRMSLVQAMAVTVPLTFGALGSTVGLTPVFWAVGSCLAAGGFWSRSAARKD
ncbi:MAG: MFS transporter [Burkholderiales bacterium]